MIECFRSERVLNVNSQAYDKFYYDALNELYWVLKGKQEELEQKIKVLCGIS
jgi:hypothetical protein